MLQTGTRRPPQVCPVLCCSYNCSPKKWRIRLHFTDPTAAEAKAYGNHLKSSIWAKSAFAHFATQCWTLSSSWGEWLSAEEWKQTKLSGPGSNQGAKPRRNRAAATATGRHRFTVLSIRVVGVNNASNVSGKMMAQLKPTVLRWSKCKRDGWASKFFSFSRRLPSALSLTITPFEKAAEKRARKWKAF